MSWNKDRIVELLLEAGEIARLAKKDLRRELKSDCSVVTQADREIEAMLTSRLERPGDGVHIIGEETVDSKGDDYVRRALRDDAYVIDPIDGTSPFSHYLPNWGVSIGWMRGGELRHGAVYLPEYREIVISSERGDGTTMVEEGRLEDDLWTWRELPPLGVTRAGAAAGDVTGLVAITQALAKRGRCDLRNPVMALGAAVVPLVGLLQGRFVAYLGSVRLWDAAGALPLILAHGFSVTIEVDGQPQRVGAAVDDSSYVLSPGDPARWYFRSSLLICRTEDEERMRRALIEESRLDRE